MTDNTIKRHPLRIAMWSCPRSLSTALMRAWESRKDTMVWDEPLYPAYLYETKEYHPHAQKIIATYETDWQKVIYKATVEHIPDSPKIFYQKYISYNYLDVMGFEWLSHLKNCFLIRNPYDLVLSLAKQTSTISVERTGIMRLYKIYQYVTENIDSFPPIIDAQDLQNNPKQTLKLLCNALDVPFDSAMLNWSSGSRQSDGIWSNKWYDAVVQTSEFKSYTRKEKTIAFDLLEIIQACQDIYQKLYEKRLY